MLGRYGGDTVQEGVREPGREGVMERMGRGEGMKERVREGRQCGRE